MREFGHIYLSWRKGLGHKRHIIGVIKRSITKGTTFEYIDSGIEEARADGFSPYIEFPDIERTYDENVAEIFGQRLIKSERADIQDFYKFWEIDQKFKEDKLYMLAHTQGWIPTDNFEFLADFTPVRTLCFMTDLAYVSAQSLKRDTVKVGDLLRYELDKKELHDKHAVKVFLGETFVGYIKKIHSRVFHHSRRHKLKLTVKALDQNGIIKRIFVKVSY